MNWVLVVVVAGAPVLTDLKFTSLLDCMVAEQRMRAEQVVAINQAISRQKPDEKTISFWLSQATHGTCIPTKHP